MDKKHTVDKQVFGQRLKYLMTNFNETTYSMSRKFNLSPPSISRYTRGEMAPKITTIREMAAYFDVSPLWLMGRPVSMYEREVLSDTQAFGAEVTLSVFGSIKYQLPVFSNEKTIHTLTLPSDQLAKWGPVFAMEITDASMEPTLMKNDYVVVKLNTFLKSGDLTALHVGESDLKIRKVSFRKNQVILQPHNPAFEVEIYDLNKDNVQVIGSVVYQKCVYERFFECY